MRSGAAAVLHPLPGRARGTSSGREEQHQQNRFAMVDRPHPRLHLALFGMTREWGARVRGGVTRGGRMPREVLRLRRPSLRMTKEEAPGFFARQATADARE
jgi:hypothetical protein